MSVRAIELNSAGVVWLSKSNGLPTGAGATVTPGEEAPTLVGVVDTALEIGLWGDEEGVLLPTVTPDEGERD